MFVVRRAFEFEGEVGGGELEIQWTTVDGYLAHRLLFLYRFVSTQRDEELSGLIFTL